MLRILVRIIPKIMFLKFNHQPKLPLALPRFVTKTMTVSGYDFVLRRATIADIDTLVRIEEAVYAGVAPWVLRDFLSELSRPHIRLYLVIERHQQVIGFAGVAYQRDQRDIHITNIAVVPIWQSHGLGTTILSEIHQFATAVGVATMTLEARASNHGAIALYQRLGFEQKGIKKGYYFGDHEDAVSMVKQLENSTSNN